MRNILTTVKRAIGVPTDIDEYDEEYYEEDEKGYEERRQSPSEIYEEKRKASAAQSKVVSLPNEMNEMKVVYSSPRSYDEARSVCDSLKAWAPVIVKLDKVDKEEAQRVIDFIMGACYTLDGQVLEIKEDVFLVAPSMVNIEKDSDEIKSIKSSSFFAKFIN